MQGVSSAYFEASQLMVRLRMLRSQRRFISLDIGALDWYTRRDRACDKPLILLISLALRGNPSLRSELN